ncbi:hypothetical protein PLESTM_001562700 [Pleodorina starrii]|nr:hypothetical protein PLESTM_001562700 [Pleodorina starrii]
MARLLLQGAVAESHEASKMGGLAGGAWLGIGIVIGFVLGICTYATVCYILRRKNLTPPSQVRPSAQRISTGGFSNIAPDLRTTPSANNLTTLAPLPTKPSSAEAAFFSPLQTSIAKATNIRGSTNTAALSDPALYGSHGFALLQVNPNAAGAAAFMQPDTEANGAAAPNASVPATTYPVNDAATPKVDRLVTQPSGRDTADQGLQARQPHQRGVSVADAYGAEDLDDEWAVVLGDLDSMLAQKGQPGLASPERAVAVRRLIGITGSRGMQYALEAALQDVMRYRARQQ